MISYRNEGSEVVVFHDDAGKHYVDPGQVFTLAGDQHAAYVSTLKGVVEVETPEPLPAEATLADLRARADLLGLTVSSKATKAQLAEVIAEAETGTKDADDTTTDGGGATE